MADKTMKAEDPAKCYFYGKEVDPEDSHCFGCGENVCGDCDLGMLMGSHDVGAHREEDDLEW